MEVIHRIPMDFTRPEQFRPRIDAVQGDSLTRVAELVLMEEGSAWVVPEGAAVRVRYHKPDDTGGSYDTLPDGSPAWSAEGNVLRLILAPQMLTVPGRVEAQGELVAEQNVLATFSFYVMVQEDPSLGVVASEDYVNWLGWMESELDERLTQARDSGEFTPDISIGAVTMLPAGSAATAVISGPKNAPVLDLGIPDGVMQCWESAAYPGCYYRVTDGVLEWDNPPMLPWTEYRTTERFLGKPVYVFVMEMTNLNGANGAQADLDDYVKSVDKMFACGGILSDGKALPYCMDMVSVQLGLEFPYLWVYNETGAFGDVTATVWVRYTKATDEALISVDTDEDTLIITTGLPVRTDGDAIIIGGV